MGSSPGDTASPLLAISILTNKHVFSTKIEVV